MCAVRVFTMAGLTGWFARRTHFKAALGDSVAQASRDFAAAVHLLRDALTLRAPLEAVAPDAYTDLDGT